jgi:hypothetical protein
VKIEGSNLAASTLSVYQRVRELARFIGCLGSLRSAFQSDNRRMEDLLGKMEKYCGQRLLNNGQRDGLYY